MKVEYPTLQSGQLLLLSLCQRVRHELSRISNKILRLLSRAAGKVQDLRNFIVGINRDMPLHCSCEFSHTFPVPFTYKMSHIQLRTTKISRRLLPFSRIKRQTNLCITEQTFRCPFFNFFFLEGCI